MDINDWVTFFTQTPVFIASSLETQLGIPIKPYYPTDMRVIIDNLPGGWVEWEGSLEETLLTNTIAGTIINLAVTVVLEASDLEQASGLQREYMGQIIGWCKAKKKLSSNEVGIAVNKLTPRELDWIELTEAEGLETFGRTIRVVNVFIGLEVRST